MTGVPSRPPPTAFMNFCRDWRERVMTENPQAVFGEVGRLLTIKWQGLDEEEKRNYIEEAAADRAWYDMKMDAALAAEAAGDVNEYEE